MVAMAITCTVTMVITILFIFNQAEHFPILLLSLLCYKFFHVMTMLISVFIVGKRKMAAWPALHVVLLAEVSG